MGFYSYLKHQVDIMVQLSFACGVAFFVFFICLVNVAQAQAAEATTDPSEARVLNSIFSKWGISANTTLWNISGEVCSGRAIDNITTVEAYNPFIKCDCSFGNGTTCHIIALRVYALNVVGEIPEELWSLTYLTNLNIGQNYLTGSLLAAIGNLTRMQYLSVGVNNLAGELPKELGNLSQLKSLAFGTNKFSGSLPSELGKLTKLEQLYFDSSGISGPIPSTFANLTNLETIWASDMEFGGQIPDFIGNWSKLRVLRFQGNSFKGLIPSSFSKLTSLSELRISDMSNGSSSLEFIRNMKSLVFLELRNNNINGSIPSFIGEFQNLTQLDLSFNNISGHIPESIFNSSSLSYVFLGNNILSGTLPRQKSSSLQNIDLSYNNLSNDLPSWVNEPNLQLNLVANNFTIEGSNISGLPSGLGCLQKNFPCNSGVGRYSNFAIKCGGPQILSTDGTVYEMDNATLGPATYFVTEAKRWAISNVGLYTGNYHSNYKSLGISEILQTARRSASSLRYYGLGLENGFYNITLLFSEIGILSDTLTWESLGRRVFDVYIQGTLVLKDFDILEEAGGSKNGIIKEFRSEVLQNYLEIHLFWAGKGTCCIPSQGTYGPLIQAIRAVADFTPTVSNEPPNSKENKTDFPDIVNTGPTSSKKDSTGLIVGIVVAGVISFLSVFVFLYIIYRRKHQNDDEELLGIDTKPYTFSYSELKNATNDFRLENKLGEGGFGSVHKGTLNDGRAIAVKRLSVGSNQGKSQFVAEIATISAVQHRNLVKLYGCCIKGREKLLVYEYLANKSLDQALFGNRLTLNWSTRYDICLGVARDFGLAKLYDDKMTHMSTRVAGTIGYLAPEYAMRGHLTEKADVFSFGVMALELVSGRPNSYSSMGEEKVYLLEWAWELHESNCISDLVDPRLIEFDEEEVKRIVGIVLLCTQASPILRPSMSRVVAMLSGDIEVSSVTTKPGYLTDWNFEDVTSFMTNITSYENSPSSATTLDGVDQSPISASKPILVKNVADN
ncbi:hypothetical protein VNO80_25800 [Phaseolus coccineus]|uniref:non-specific serine/threonine protein kinase n=1 Tax=Phaseolus coccineus TaxID=3886 RepID=A0AAN9QP18_PHACN